MLNKLFKEKEKLNELQKNMLKNLCLFFENNKYMFSKNINSQKEKKEIIKQIYLVLNFSDIPILENNQEIFNTSFSKIYRGISAENEEILNSYINDFIYGEPFYGGRASIYGTGIYTVLGENFNVASDYASDGGINNCGTIIESVMSNDSKIINSSQIDSIRNILIEKIKKIYSDEIENYIDILQDDGAFSAIVGYDAIFVEEKNYMVVLNRNKMIVNGIVLDYLKENEENYPIR